MKSFKHLLFTVFLLFLVADITKGLATQADKKQNTIKADYISLSGEALPDGNPIEADGNIHRFNLPVLHLLRTESKSPKGTILLLPGGRYEVLNVKNQGEKTAKFLNIENFDVAILEYHVGKDSHIRNLSLKDALQAYRLLSANRKLFGLNDDRLSIMGISSGGHLAARTVQNLGEKELPDNLILISPAYLNENLTGSVYPAVMPPIQPAASLFATFSANDNKSWITSCAEYAKTWKGYDGIATFNLLNDSAFIADKDMNPLDGNLKLAGLLKTFLESKSKIAVSAPNPAAIPVEGYAKERHLAKLELVAKEKFDLIMIGNSITHNFEKPEYQPVWNQYYAPRKALNLGTSGYRTENLIWNIQNGELDGQSPKVVVLEIGTNNVDEKNYPTRHTADQLAGGIEAIVRLLRDKLPDTKIIVLRCFPGCYGGPNPTSHRAILEHASDIVSRLADGKHIFFCDVNHVFLNQDGSINRNMMEDWLHPTPAGARAWAQAMEPLLSELMGDKSLDTDIPSNTAIVPVSKLEYDSYNWWDRHTEALRIKDSVNPEIVLIGNSITHFWGGEPKLKYADGKPRNPNGPNSWASIFGNYRVLNLGFGWDRTQNVLWRLDHSELDGLHPRIVIIDIGTNNTSETPNARINTAPEIVEGIRAVCLRVRSKVPGAKIVLMAIFPREQNPSHPRRILIDEINKQLKVFAGANKIDLVDIGPKMLSPDGTLSREIANDFCHPTDKGYQIWADELRPFVNEL
jgi:lysophospholipase L1-like esterase/acetyl esterase/lipase